MPKDPEDSLDRIRNGGVLRAGAIENRPFVHLLYDGRVVGVEAGLVEEFARSLGARVEWQTVSGYALFEALHHQKLDVLVGGFTDSSPYLEKVAPTQAFLDAEFRIGSRSVESLPADLEDVPVQVDADHPLMAHYLDEVDARPRPVKHLLESDPANSARPLLAEDWRLQAWGLAMHPEVLHRDKHIMMVAQGENRLLLELDRFLQQNIGKAAIRQRMQAAVRAADGATTLPEQSVGALR